MFISKLPIDGQHYIAKRSQRGPKFLWWVLPRVAPARTIGGAVRIDADAVPKHVRKQAYRLFEADRIRERA
jgi:hypothetical protein